MVFSTASALYGYVLLAVQVLIWWMFQLSCIQTITCVYDMLAQYEKRYLAHKIHSEADAEKAKKGSMLSIITVSHNKHINVTWFYDFVYMALVPMLSVFSLLLSIWWAADVFDLTATVWNIFMFNFLNVTGVVQLSIGKMVMVLSQFFLFRYINYLVKSLYHKYHKSKVVVNGKPNFTLANNIIAICCWSVLHHLDKAAEDTVDRNLRYLCWLGYRCGLRHEGPARELLLRHIADDRTCACGRLH